MLDKGKAAAVTTIIETREKRSGTLIFENQSTVSSIRMSMRERVLTCC